MIQRTINGIVFTYVPSFKWAYIKHGGTSSTGYVVQVPDSDREPGVQITLPCGTIPRGHLSNKEANLLLSLERFDRTGNYGVVRMVNGFSKQVDRGRLSGSGNSIVPQVAYEIFKAIQKVNETHS